MNLSPEQSNKVKNTKLFIDYSNNTKSKIAWFLERTKNEVNVIGNKKIDSIIAYPNDEIFEIELDIDDKLDSSLIDDRNNDYLSVYSKDLSHYSAWKLKNACNFKKGNIVSVPLKNENGMLIGTKEYSNTNEVIADFFNFFFILRHTNLANILSKNTGFETFYLDGQELIKNRLVLHPLIPQQLDEIKNEALKYGYTLVDSPKKANKVAIIHFNGFARIKNLKEYDKAINPTNAKGNHRVGPLAMSIASHSGSSNGSSAGIGAAFFLLGFLTSNNNDFYDSHYIYIYDNINNEEKNRSVLIRRGESFHNAEHVYSRSIKYEKENIVNFLSTGELYMNGAHNIVKEKNR